MYIQRVYLFFIFSYCGFVTSQDDQSNDTTATPTDKIQENIISSILKIVDDKFDSISARIGTLERAIIGLQYDTVRQSHEFSVHLKSLDSHMLSTQHRLGDISVEHKAVTNSLGLLKTEIKSMETLQNGMSEAFEQNFVYLNKDISAKISHIQRTIGAVNLPDSDQNSNIGDQGHDQGHQWCNCSEAMNRIEEKIDLFRTETVDQISKVDRPQREVNQSAVNTLYNTMTRVNYNLEQSINFYRYTGELVERIVGATETVSEDQTKIREDLRHFLQVQTNNTCTNEVVTDTRYELPNDINPNNNVIDGENYKCKVPLRYLRDVMHLSKNNTQLLEIVTDLAQLSQISLKSSVLQIQTEVMKLQNERMSSVTEKRQNPEIQPETSVNDGDFETLLNISKSVHKMMEGVASSTGWIPYIFHNLQYVEGRVNETILLSRSLLNQISTSGTIIPSNQTSISRTEQPENFISTGNVLPVQVNGSLSRGVLNKLNFMYNTNSKLYRLIPALTRLLGEPEPFITLVAGPKENEGRIEVYKKGRWGTICKSLGHIEAAYICRHLGYLGGISAGSGSYGPGSGVFWQINITCLYSRQCEIAVPVLDTKNCDHVRDAGIICDHMIRLTPGDDELSMRNIGRLDIYHNEEYLPVCSDDWLIESTRVACRQLGYDDGELTEARDSDIMQDGNVWMMNVVCTGSENRLDGCNHKGWTLNGCKSRKPVILHCQ